MMDFVPKFLQKIVKAVLPSKEEAGIMSIIIQRPYAHLEKELTKTFEGQKDVQVIVDRRYAERRKTQQDVEYRASSCRQASTKGRNR